MLSSPSPTRPHGHAVRRTTLARRRHLAAAAAAGAAVATLALLAAGRAPCAGPGAPWTAAWAAVDDAPAASNRLADVALAGDGAGVEAGGSTAPPPHPAGTAVILVLDAAHAEAAAASAAAAAVAGSRAAPGEVVVVADGPAVAAALADTTIESIPGLRLLARTTPGGPAAARNDGARAARAPLFTVLPPGVRLAPGYWDAVVAGAASGEEDDFLFTGPPADPPPADGGDTLPATLPWFSPHPPATAVRKAAWARLGGYAVAGPPLGGPLGAGDPHALLLAAAVARRGDRALGAQIHEEPLFAVDAGAAVGAPPLLATSAAVAACGAPLAPSTVLRAHAHILATASADAAAADALFKAAAAMAAAATACPLSAPADVVAGLVREAVGRVDDAAAAFARAARCATRAGVPALAWAARLRADAVRVAALRRCAVRAAPAAEPGDPPRPPRENAKADAGECVALLLGEVV